MAYRVRILPRAEKDLDAIYLRIRAPVSEPAELWFEGLIQAIHSLSKNPERCPITSENSQFRHLLCGRGPNVYRILFRIAEKPRRVIIAHIRHGAQKPFIRSDVN